MASRRTPIAAALGGAALVIVLLAALPAAPARAEDGPRWSELSPAQRTALKPLEREWATIPADRKDKWMRIAGRMPGMPPAERDRVQARMTEWARMSPQQRSQARLAYQEAKQVPSQDRQARWESYQALTAEQRRQLQQRAAPPPPTGRPSQDRVDRLGDRPQLKSNIVPNPAYAAPPKPVAPTVMQARPGVSTQLMSKRPAPPPHQQIGLPKIAATPGFVDSATLLPQRGAQGAATARPPGAASRPRGRD